MITEAMFRISIDDSVQLLNDMKLFKGRGVKSPRAHSNVSKKVSKSNRHTEIFNTAIENKDYEILLIDDSIFQFSRTNDSLRFAFIQNPNIFVTKLDYLSSFSDPFELVSLTDEELEELVNSIDEEEFSQFLNEQEINLGANIIRYDLGNQGYSPLVHSYSHVHVGLNPAFRIPCSKAISPLSFVFFSIKHTYYRQWKLAIEHIEKFPERINHCKQKCSDVPLEYWDRQEPFELFLT